MRTPIENTPDVFFRFEHEYFKLNPKGNLMSAWTNIYYQASNGAKNAHGEDICLEDLIESYKDYLIFWKRSYSQTDEKFISKDNKQMDPELFIMQRSYQSFWIPAKSLRDEYLFGDTDEEYRVKRLSEFLVGVPKLPKKKR